MEAYIKLYGAFIKFFESHITKKTGIIFLVPYQYYDSPLLLLYVILIVALIFIVGICIDYMLLAFIEKPVMKQITSYIESSQLWVAQKVPF